MTAKQPVSPNPRVTQPTGGGRGLGRAGPLLGDVNDVRYNGSYDLADLLDALQAAAAKA